MKKVASERRRFGYRRIHVMLDRQGIVINLKKLRRLNREEKLTCASAAAEIGPWGRGVPWLYRRAPTSAVARTSSAMPSPTVAGSVF